VLAGGRYDGLIGSLGGPETAGVGWAAGIERLAMLLDEPAAEALEVAVVAESAGLERAAIAFATALRRGGVSTELFISGSPRKRYDKAVSRNPAQTVSLSTRDGISAAGWRILREGVVSQEMTHFLLDPLIADLETLTVQ
jgi:histidyl-tRNA synthetase